MFGTSDRNSSDSYRRVKRRLVPSVCFVMLTRMGLTSVVLAKPGVRLSMEQSALLQRGGRIELQLCTWGEVVKSCRSRKQPAVCQSQRPCWIKSSFSFLSQHSVWHEYQAAEAGYKGLPNGNLRIPTNKLSHCAEALIEPDSRYSVAVARQRLTGQAQSLLLKPNPATLHPPSPLTSLRIALLSFW